LQLRGRMQEAEAEHRLTVEEAGRIASKSLEAKGLRNLGWVLFETGRMDQARAVYQQALAVSREMADRRFEGDVLGSLANLNHQQGRIDQAQDLYEQALAIDRDVGDRRGEAIVVGHRAAWELIVSGDTSRAAKLASEGEALLREVGDKLELSKLRCTRGHIRLASGTRAARLIAEVDAIGGDLRVGPDSELGNSLAKLRRAQAACDAGKPLVCGYLADDLTEGQLRWLAEHRPEALAG